MFVMQSLSRGPKLIGGRYSEGHICCKMTSAGFTVVVVDRWYAQV